jgi:hypothetical protein
LLHKRFCDKIGGEMLNSWQRDLWLILGVIFAFLQVVVGVLALLFSSGTDAQRARQRSAIKQISLTFLFLAGYITLSTPIVALLGIEYWSASNGTGLEIMRIAAMFQMALLFIALVRLYVSVRDLILYPVLLGGISSATLIACFSVNTFIPPQATGIWVLVKLYIETLLPCSTIIAFFSFWNISIKLYKRALYHGSQDPTTATTVDNLRATSVNPNKTTI